MTNQNDANNHALVVRINALCERLDRDYSERIQERKETKQYRDRVQADLQALYASTEETRRRMDKVEPVADMVTGWRAKVTGGILVLGFIGGIAWAGITFFRDELKAIILGG
jgi:hypothetical protein